MTRLLAACTVLGTVAFGCTLDYERCGENDVGCSGEHSVCVCATGRCADPDTDCESGYHYVGSRCVPAFEAETAVDSTPAEPGMCNPGDGGADADARDDSGDARYDARDVRDSDASGDG